MFVYWYITSHSVLPFRQISIRRISTGAKPWDTT